MTHCCGEASFRLDTLFYQRISAFICVQLPFLGSIIEEVAKVTENNGSRYLISARSAFSAR